MRFYFNAAQMLEVSLLGFLVTGAFLSMSYFDLFFHLVAITALIRVLVAENAVRPVGVVAGVPVPPRVVILPSARHRTMS
jgi:hypothetical protein